MDKWCANFFQIQKVIIKYCPRSYLIHLRPAFIFGLISFFLLVSVTTLLPTGRILKNVLVPTQQFCRHATETIATERPHERYHVIFLLNVRDHFYTIPIISTQLLPENYVTRIICVLVYICWTYRQHPTAGVEPSNCLLSIRRGKKKKKIGGDRQE